MAHEAIPIPGDATGVSVGAPIATCTELICRT